MIDAFYTAKSGVKAYQQSLDVVSNNMANANTTGFKTQRAAFTDLLYQNLQAGNGAIQGGSGSKIKTTLKDLSQGSIEQTGRILDFSILGSGFYAVAKGLPDNNGNTTNGNTVNSNTPNGNIFNENNAVKIDTDNIFYTRAGDFTISIEKDKSYLVTKNGEYVLNDKFEKIVLDGDLNNIIFASPQEPNLQENAVTTIIIPPEQTEENKYLKEPVIIGVFRFNNPYSLTAIGDGRFTANTETGTAAVLYGSNISGQTLEHSNVDLISEMQRMMTAQRGFQFGSRVIQTADEMEQIANTLSS